MYKLQVTADILNIRNTPEVDPTNANWVSDLLKDSEVFAIDLVKGKINEGIDEWYKDSFNRFYWRGGVKKIADIVPFDPIKMSWAFKNPDGIDIFSLWNEGLVGQGVRVAVLDSGINTSVTDIMNAVKDKNLDLKFFTGDNVIDDDDGHGTKCASILAARGQKIFGTAPGCELLIGKIRTAAQTYTTQILLDALKWACEERQADIISMSFGTDGDVPDPVICNYIEAQSQSPHNKIFVGSVSDAGKFAKDLLAIPANCKGCISIGSYGPNRIACSTSGWNKQLFFTSPGDGLKGYNKEGDIVNLSCATSFACPFTAGLIACVISFFKRQDKAYTASKILEVLSSSECVDVPANHNPLQHGKGIINPAKVLSKLKTI